VKSPTVPKNANTFIASLLCKVLKAFHFVLLVSIYYITPMAAKFPITDQPIVVHTLSRLACINSLLPSSDSWWKAILGLSLYFSSRFVSFVYRLVLCSRSGLSNLYSPVASLILSCLASSLSLYLIFSLSISR